MLLKVGNRIINLDNVTDVSMTGKGNVEVALNIVNGDGEQVVIDVWVDDQANSLWDYLASQSIDVMVRDDQQRPGRLVE